jgi:hypothetical protein
LMGLRGERLFRGKGDRVVVLGEERVEGVN